MTQASDTQSARTDNAEMVVGLDEIKTKVQSAFGRVVLAMSAVPRYRHHSLADLGYLVIDPLTRDRIVIAEPRDEDQGNGMVSQAAIAIWATVSPEVDLKIREQIKGGAFPVRLKAEDWAGGDIAWLFDVIAPTQRLANSVLANFQQVAKTKELRIHPIVTRIVDPEVLNALGIKGHPTSDETQTIQ